MAILPDEVCLSLRVHAVVKISLSQFPILSGQGLETLGRLDVVTLDVLRDDRYGQD